MKLASIREFRGSLSGITKTGEMVIVMNHGKMVGCFLPLNQVQDIPIEFKKEFVAQLGRKMAALLSLRGISEKKVLDDFKEFKKNRRR